LAERDLEIEVIEEVTAYCPDSVQRLSQQNQVADVSKKDVSQEAVAKTVASSMAGTAMP
jgi:hypothetical protein